MSDGNSSRQNKAQCPGCGATIKKDVSVCPSCTLNIAEYEKLQKRDPSSANDLVPKSRIHAIKSLAGLNAWTHPAGEIALCAQVNDLQSAMMGLRKGLLVRPGTRAILVKDGKFLDALEPGSYQLSNAGMLTSGVLGRLADFIKGSHHCDIYLVDAGEFRVRMGEPESHVEQHLQGHDVDEIVDDYLQVSRAGSASNSKDPNEKVNQFSQRVASKLNKYGFGEKLEFIWGALEIVEPELEQDSNEEGSGEDLRTLREFLRDRLANVLRQADRFYSEAGVSGDLLRLKTKEGFSVELRVDLYFQVDGNMDFVNNVLRGCTILREQDLVKKIHGPLQNVLQSVARDISIDDLYANMEIRDHIRNAAKSKLAPTFSAWGLRLYRVEGFDWNLGRYEEYLSERSDLDLAKKTALVDAARRNLEKEKAEALHRYELEKLRRREERSREQGKLDKVEAEAQSEVEYTRSEGQQRIKELEHGAELSRDKAAKVQKIGLDRQKRTAQIDAMRELQAAQLEKRAAELRLAEAQREAEHRRGIERLTAETEARLKAIQIQASMSPEQILALAASHRPELIPALQAYAAGRASQTQVDLMEAFHKRLQEVFGTQQEKLTAVMEYAFKSIGNTVQGVRPQIVANPQPGRMFVTEAGATSAGVRQESGRTLCGCCGQVILPEPLPEDRLCGGCRKLGDEKPCN